MRVNHHLPIISHKGAGSLDATLSAGTADAAQRAGEAWLADYNPAAASLDKFNGAWRTWQAKKSIGQRLKQLFTRS